jgi:tetratricopeptide (TPR) repeat protein
VKTNRGFPLSFFIILFFVFIYSVYAQENISEIVKKIEPSVAVIVTYDNKGNIIKQGTGFFISENGNIITNRHLLLGAYKVELKIEKDKPYFINQIVAEDKEGDAIRLSINIPKNIVLPLQLSNNIPKVGEKVVVISSALGLEKTVSDGVVSVVRHIPTLGNIIQITAPISPHSSGNPVLNMKGEVIGIVTFQIDEEQNLHFAILSEKITTLKTIKSKTFTEWKKDQMEEWTSSSEGLYYMGLIFSLKENYRNAIQYFEKAVKKNPQYYKALFELGLAYGELGRWNEAIEAYKQIIRINPDYTDAQYNVGLIYYNLGRYNEAIEAYKQAIKIKPDYTNAYYNLGLLYDELGRYDEAIESFKQGIRISPDYADAHYNLGVSYENLGRYNEAIETYKEAIRINPDYVTAHYNLGWIYGELGRYNEAINAYKQAIRIYPDYEMAHYNIGWVYGELGKYNESIKAYKQVIRINPDYTDAHYNLGLSYLVVGNKDSALDEYKILKDLDKDLANELFNFINK